MSSILHPWLLQGFALLAAQLLALVTLAQGGVLYQSFTPLGSPGTSGANGIVWAFARQADGKILIGGDFTSYQGTPANRIARLNADGSLDLSFNTSVGFNAIVYSIVIQPDQNILVGGDFTEFNGKPHKYIIRINQYASFDPSFIYLSDSPNAGVRAIALQPNGSFVIGGVFTQYGTKSRNRIARLYANGILDASFNPGTGADNLIMAITRDSNGGYYIGGDFTHYDVISVGRTARIYGNGSLYPGFNSSIGANNNVRAITIDANGKIVVGGMFSSFNSTTRNRLVRAKPDDTVDMTFNPPSSGLVNGTATRYWRQQIKS